MKDTVLITGARAPVALDLARSFRAAGCDTHLADSVTSWAARFLRPRIPVHRLTSPRREFARFRRDMAELVGRLAPDRIVPTCEEVFWVSAAAALDGYSERVFAPPLPLLRRLHSKFDFAQLALAAGVPAPDSWAVTSREELARVPLAPSEMVLKPEFSRFSTRTLIRPTPADIAKITPSPEQRWVAQRLVEGDEVCSWAAVREGAVVAFAAYRPEWRHGKAGIAFESVDNSAALRVTRRIAAVTGMTGHLSFDLIVTPDGTAAPIECNPRAVSGIHLLDADPEVARAILGGDGIVSPPDGKLRYLGPAMAFLGFPSLSSPGRVRAFLRDWRRGRDVIGRPGNRLPALGALADAVGFAVLGAANGRSMAGQSTADIEWNGEAIG